MNAKMLELAEWSIETAKAAGAQACRAGIDNNRSVSIGYRERKPETIKETTDELASWVEKASKAAPAGSDVGFNALKSTVAATTAAFDQFQKASKQVASLADAQPGDDAFDIDLVLARRPPFGIDGPRSPFGRRPGPFGQPPPEAI